jgi:hypothetical protein
VPSNHLHPTEYPIFDIPDNYHQVSYAHQLIISAAKMTVSQNTTESHPSNGSKSINHEENQYLDLVREILESGERRPDR